MPEVVVEHKGDMLFEAKMGKYQVEIDVPEEMRGKDRAALPPQLFIASLGSCIAAFVANYCNNVNLDPSGLTVTVTYDKLQDPVRVGNMKALVKVPNADIGKRRQAVLNVAEHCILHETLRLNPKIEIVLE